MHRIRVELTRSLCRLLLQVEGSSFAVQVARKAALGEEVCDPYGSQVLPLWARAIWCLPPVPSESALGSHSAYRCPVCWKAGPVPAICRKTSSCVCVLCGVSLAVASFLWLGEHTVSGDW